MKIKELFNFEDIQQVVAINNIENEKEIVEKFVISPNLKNDLLEFLEYLKGNKIEKNTSVNVIGNYGTGKSHLLSFLSIILSNPEMVQFIQDEKLKEAFFNLKKDFVVVKYELPGQNKSLSDIFFYRVKKQLKENYGIEIRKIDFDNEEKDPKELIEEILLKIKEKYPTKGLIVIFDEYSDFLKSKESYKQNMDLQFTRQIAECSKNQDFILMLSMQEYIFSNPAYKDKADLINKIEKRFLKFNITSENIEDIIAKRMVSKTSNQIEEIKQQFDLLKEKFPNLSLEEDRYVKLFPIHPYLIEMLTNLTLFENRSILMFISQQTKIIQEEEFPAFITYDLIYDDLIESEHTIKNNESVKPIVNIVNSLFDIVPRLDSKYQERAYRLIKALALKNLVTPPNNKGEKKGGDTPEKFAENLFIIPNSSFMKPSEDIETIFNMLIQQSEGQFISKDNESNTYFINFNKTTDYEQLINNKADNMDDLRHNNEVFVEDFLLEELGFTITNEIIYAENNKKYVLEDTINWNERNSFREGVLTINIGNNLSINNNYDYMVTIKGFGSYNIKEFSSNHIIIKPKYSDEFKQSMRRLAAVNEFLRTKTHTNAMRSKKSAIIDNEIKTYFKKAFKKSTIAYKSKEYTLDELSIYSDIISEIYSNIKEKLLGEDLVNFYPEYPRFKSNAVLSKNNIEGTIETVIRDISNKNKLADFDLKSSRILIPLEIYKNNVIDVNNSKYASLILEKVECNDKNISIKSIVKKFEKKPYGFQKEITYLIIAILFRNGNIMISNKNGKTYFSSDFNELFKHGLKTFDNLKYIKKEEGPSANTQELFDILNLDRTLLELKKNHAVALKQYIVTYEKIQSDINFIIREFNNIKQSSDIGLPIDEISEKISFIEDANFESIEVNTINGFNKLDYSKEHLHKINNAYNLIFIIKSFLEDYNNFIYDGIMYMQNSIKFINNPFFKDEDIKELNKIYQDSLNIISNYRKLLKEDERRPLEGKIQQFKKKYKSIYYNTHERFVGKNVDWQYLDELENSKNLQKLKKLNNVLSVNSTKLREIQLNIQSLKELHCNNMNVDDLEHNYHCICMFPNNLGNHTNINKEIEDLWQKSSELLNSWEKEIIISINDNKSKLNQLDFNQKEIIVNILNSNMLPEKIDSNLINTINCLLEDLEIKDVNINDLYKILTSERDTLKIEEAINLIENCLNKNIKDKDIARIRFVKDKESLYGSKNI